jgi:uncharacterized membrane protein YgdD (TMEM256/DUF423 family)
MTARIALVTASLLAAIGVAAGAFGAHALKSRLTADMLAVWQTAVLYHLVHALALLAAGLLLLARPDAVAARWAAWLFVAGIVVFSGSLYALTLSGVRALGAITPLGGLAMIGGWIALAFAAWRATAA